MNAIERMKMVKAMEFIARQVNNEEAFCDFWLPFGVPDGDIAYGDLTVTEDDIDGYYCGGDGWTEAEANEHFEYLMTVFLNLMSEAYEDGGLCCDDVTTKWANE